MKRMQKLNTKVLFTTLLVCSFWYINSQTVVNSLAGLNTAMQSSNQSIVLEAGNYDLEDLSSNSRAIICSGSNNTIDLTGVLIRSRVGSVGEVYFIISGDNNIFKNGAIEDYYQSGLEEVTDFSAYNNDRSNLADGLGGDPIMEITGDDNLVEGLEMTVKGSFPYGYGSQYGIGSTNTFGLNKRCGILITGKDGGGSGNTLDGITMYHYAFGHGIFMQTGATETTIKNCYVEGRVRLSDDIYNDTETYDLPYRTDYKFPSGDDWRTLPFVESYDIPSGENSVVYPLSEDGIRSYNSTGSVVVENCTVKQMRGGIRLYLASSATVTNSTAIDCGSGGTNYNMPNGGTITGSSGNFSYTSLNDNRLSRSNQNIEMTIIPSPHAIGPHNIADILGNNQDIVFHRTPGPLDSDEERTIVVSGDNSTIVNETEYTIILESGASGNDITSCGTVIDNGSGNTIVENTDCDFDLISTGCSNTTALIEAECYDDMLGIETEESSEGTDNIGFIEDGDWTFYSDINLGTINTFNARVASENSGTIEVRLDSLEGELLTTISVASTGDWQDWTTLSESFNPVGGIHDIYLAFNGGASYLFNVNWVGFTEEVVPLDCNGDVNGIATTDACGICSGGNTGVEVDLCLQCGDPWATSVDGTNVPMNVLDNDLDSRWSGKGVGEYIEVCVGEDPIFLESIDVAFYVGDTRTTTFDIQVSLDGLNWTTVLEDAVSSGNTLEKESFTFLLSEVWKIKLIGKGNSTNDWNSITEFSWNEVITSTSSYDNNNSIDVFPNPSSEEVTINSRKMIIQVNVLNVIGRRVLDVTINEVSGKLDVSSLSKGVYLMEVILEDGSSVKQKFTKE